MANEERIAHYELAGLTLAQFRESKDNHHIFETRGRKYFAKECEARDGQDRSLLCATKIKSDEYHRRDEQRKKALEVLGNEKNLASYYLLLCTEDTALTDAFKDATPRLLDTFKHIASTMYRTQFWYRLMATESFVSQENLQYILEESKLLPWQDVNRNVSAIIQDLEPKARNEVLDPALFCLLDHKRDMLTLEQIEVIERRKAVHMQRIKDNPPKKTHFERLDIHFPYSFAGTFNFPTYHEDISEILTQHITKLETRINKMVAKTEGTQTKHIKITETPEKRTKIQVDGLERLRDMAGNLPQETEAEKKDKKDILQRIDALCILTDPNRACVYHYLIRKSPEFNKIFIDASPELIDKTIDNLCVFAKLYDKIQESGLSSIGNVEQAIAKEYQNNGQYGSNDAEIRKAKAGLASSTIKDSEMLCNMALCSTLVELYDDQDFDLTAEQRRTIEEEVAFHNQKPQNEPQHEVHSHYDRLRLTAEYDIRNLVDPDYELAENDMPPRLYGIDIFPKLLEEKKANTDRTQQGVRHNFEVHQEIHEEYNSLLGAQELCRNEETRRLYNAALDHSNRIIRKIARNLSEEDFKILRKALFLESASDRQVFENIGKTNEMELKEESKYNLLKDPDRTKWEPEISRIFKSSGVIQKYYQKLYKNTSLFSYIICRLSDFIQNIRHSIVEYFSPNPMQARGHYASSDRKECYGEEILEPPQQIPAPSADEELEPEKGRKLENENPRDPQPERDPNPTDQIPQTMNDTNSTNAIPSGTSQSK